VSGSGRLRVGLVGAGRIAPVYAQALACCRNARLCGVADVKAEAAADLARTVGCRSFASHRHMLAAGDLDAAIVCTPPVTHPAISLDLLASGLHVLCEKPFSIRVAEARQMIAAARTAGLVITMASKFRFVDDVIAAKRLVDSGVFGHVSDFENTFVTPVDMRGRWNANPSVSGGGVLIDNGTHAVDLARFFLGPLKHVDAEEGARRQGLGVEETVRLRGASHGDTALCIELSWNDPPPTDTYLHLRGTAGSLSLGWKQSHYRHGDGSAVVFGHGYDKVQAFTRQIENFASAIAGEDALVVTPADALASVDAIAAAYRSLRQNRQTAIGDSHTAPPL